MRWRVRGALALALGATGASAVVAAAQPQAGPVRSRVVVDGAARFEVLSPTLVRVEYAGDRHFEDRLTFNVLHRDLPVPAYTTRVVDGYREVRTARLTLRWRRGSGPFTPATLGVTLRVGRSAATARPAWRNGTPYTLQAEGPDRLGGWRRGLDGQAGPAPMGEGLLSRSGWYLLDDTDTALYDGPGRVVPRPGHGGQPYQDGYFFGYGHDYRQGLRDLRAVTGPAPLLPRWTFGVWFSDYHPFTDADYRRRLLPAFRRHRVPLDGLVVDTDWKSPNHWNGWEWRPALFPDPAGFLHWAATQGLHVVLNVHPSIGPNDPRLPEAQRRAHGRLRQTVPCFAPDGNYCYVFDLGDPAQAAAYFWLHRPFTAAGVRLWWLDWCCDSTSVSTPGVTPDTWVNSLYAADADARGERGFAFSRIGSAYTAYTAALVGYPAGPWAEHRYTLHFTGDTAPTWPMLAFQAQFTAAEGAIGLPYVSHDIGGFYTKHDADDLYARWVQLGTFQPVLRLHSDDGDRLPWQYGAAAERSAERFLRLRESLLPYTYSTAREAHDTGLPMTRALYLDWPEQPAAYAHPTQFMYGDSLLVAPVTTPGTRVTTRVWFPPGRWTDLFTGRSYRGPGTHPVTTTLDTMPAFVRGGGLVTQHTSYADSDAAGPLDAVTVVAARGTGSAGLYEDAGEGHGYLGTERTTTPLSVTAASTRTTLRIGRAEGAYPGRVRRRSWTVRLLDSPRPSRVLVDGAALPARAQGPGWSYDPAHRVVVVRVPPRATARATVVTVEAPAR